MQFRWLKASTAALAPTTALACALPPSIILTLPTGYYLWGAGLTVALTAWIAAKSGPEGRAAPPQREEALVAPLTPIAIAPSYAAFLVFLGLIAIGFWGPRDPMHNLLTLIFWTVIWVALPLACMVGGNLWRYLNPWSGPVQLTRALIGRERAAGLRRWGSWPAVAGFLGFSWFQIVSLSPEDPLVLARLASLYWGVIFLLAVAEGEDFLWRGEFFSHYMALLSKVSPIRRQDGRWRVGMPGARILAMPPLDASGVAFVTLVLAALSFDGLRETFWWLGQIGENPLEFTGRSAVQIENTLGLAAAWMLTAGLVLGALRLGGRLSGRALKSGPVLLSFLAIAAGYHGAHYLMMLLTAGQYLLAALNDPFFQGDALLGLSPFYVSYGFLTDRSTMTLLWNLQFGLILGAHVLAVWLSHRLAGRGRSPWALAPLDALMVAYTIFGLWLLASPTGT